MAFKLLSRPGHVKPGAAPDDWSDFELLNEHERHDLEAAIHIDDRIPEVMQEYLHIVGFCQQSGFLLVRDLAVDRVSQLVRPDVLHRTDTDDLSDAFAEAKRSILRQLDTATRGELALHLVMQITACRRIARPVGAHA